MSGRRDVTMPGSEHLDRIFETHTDAWEAVGLAAEVRRREVRRAWTRAILLLLVLAGVIVAYAMRTQLFGPSAGTPARITAVTAIVILGWAVARDVGRSAAPTFFRRLDPATAGTVGFLIRLATIAVTLLVALDVAEVSPSTLVAGSAFTAVIVGLAAQQTLATCSQDSCSSARVPSTSVSACACRRVAWPAKPKVWSVRWDCSTRRWRKGRIGSWSPTTSSSARLSSR
jgi:small conductance mechanosensitive channel